MKQQLKQLAEMCALGAISEYQIQEVSGCSDEQYMAALEYADKYSHAHDEYHKWMETLYKNPDDVIYVLNSARMNICFDKQNAVFHCVELHYTLGNSYQNANVDIIEYALNSVQAFKFVKPDLFKFEKEWDDNLPF